MISVPAINTKNFASTNAVSCRPQPPRSSTNISNLSKVAGFLAFAVCGAAQAADTANNGLKGSRQLQGEDTFEPFDYLSVCENDIAELYRQGMTYEDCLIQENAQIDAISQASWGKKREFLTCMRVTGAVAGGFSILAVIGHQNGSEGVLCGSALVTTVALIPTFICGLAHSQLDSSIEDTKEVAESCCKQFPKQADVQKALTSSTPTQFESQAPTPAPIV